MENLDRNIDVSPMLNYDPENPASVLELQLFLCRNSERIPKLSPTGRQKIREMEEDDEIAFKDYCVLYGKFCYPNNTNPETIINNCSRNIACGDKSYFESLI